MAQIGEILLMFRKTYFEFLETWTAGGGLCRGMFVFEGTERTPLETYHQIIMTLNAQLLAGNISPAIPPAKLVIKDTKPTLPKVPTAKFGDIDKMSGTEFEELLSDLFTKMGFQAKRIGGSGDQGGDIIVTRFASKIVIQAKRSITPITNTAIQEVIGAIGFYNCDKGMVITSNIFNKSARELAGANNIELIDRKTLDKLLDEYYP